MDRHFRTKNEDCAHYEPRAQTRGLLKFASPVLIAAALGGIFWASAGDLNPPVGTISPTMKTLVEVEPRTQLNQDTAPGDANSILKITQEGSYYLMEDVNGVSGKHGIEITAGSVTVDLNGFALIGVSGSLDGVVGTNAHVAVINGNILSWGGSGVNLSGISTRVERVQTGGNGSFGARAGQNSLVSKCLAYQNGGAGFVGVARATFVDCVASNNGAQGILTGTNGLVIDCQANGNQEDGISVDKGRVSGCISDDNGGTGIHVTGSGQVVDSHCLGNNGHGVEVGDGSLVSNCVVTGSGADGIRAQAGCVIVHCTARRNGLDVKDPPLGGAWGIGVFGLGGTVRGCTASENANGILGWTYTSVIGCSSVSNGSQGISGSGQGIQLNMGLASECSIDGNLNGGIWATGASTIVKSKVENNSTHGIYGGSLVRSCTVNGNDGPGILTMGGHVVGNQCGGNTAAGIHVENASGNLKGARVEANHVVGNDIGIFADGVGNLIIKNTASGNTTQNYDLSMNHFGQIITTPGAGFTNPYPWANFSF